MRASRVPPPALPVALDRLWLRDPEYALARKRFWDAFSAHLGGMPAQMARAFAMHAIDGRDTDEVCAALGITPGNLWVLLHRARGKLRDAVDGDSRQYFLGLR